MTDFDRYRDTHPDDADLPDEDIASLMTYAFWQVDEALQSLKEAIIAAIQGRGEIFKRDLQRIVDRNKELFRKLEEDGD